MVGKIIVAHPSAAERKIIVDILRKAGHQVVAETSDMGHTFRRARTLYCDLVVVDSGLEGGTGIKTATIIEEDQLAAVLFLANSDNDQYAKRFHYLVKPIYDYTLVPAVESALLFWRRQNEMMSRIRQLEDKLETRKMVDKAKALLMKKGEMSENDAHRFIQKEAMRRGATLREVAADILARGSLASDTPGKESR
ncbi:MAG: ANTAR domain-containing protein [Syntrophomonadaceae bacterium]